MGLLIPKAEKFLCHAEAFKVPRRPELQLSDVESSAAQIDLCRQDMTVVGTKHVTWARRGGRFQGKADMMRTGYHFRV